jgi:glutamate synthase (NADPH/NADH) small chain
VPAKPSTKQRLQIDRQKMTEQDPLVRNANFDEVNLGLPEKVALLEAERCLLCRDPKCISGCPVMVNIPRFIEMLWQGNLPEAAQCLLHDNALPSITGRVCPQETQCEIECIRGNKGLPVAIGYLERYVGDWAHGQKDQQSLKVAPSTGKKVAVVGSGPGGLTAAGELAKCGHAVTVFEALHKPGGVLVYGIPEFRLPKKIVEAEVARLEQSGVKIVCNTVIGRTYTVQELRDQFDAVFIANGAGLPVFMNVAGENFKGVYSANEYLTRVNLMAAYQFPRADTPVLKGQRVATVGGGNVAMDSARTAKRLGAESSMIVYRRTRKEMPARAEEIHHAEEEGLQFEFLVAPIEVIGNDKKWVAGLKCVRMNLGEPDSSGRARPIVIPGSEFVIPCDVVVVAIGTRANPLLTATCPDLKLNKWGNIIVDEKGMTSLPGVFAGGDIVRGAATVILAMGDGKRAAKAMDDYLSGKA